MGEEKDLLLCSSDPPGKLQQTLFLLPCPSLGVEGLQGSWGTQPLRAHRVASVNRDVSFARVALPCHAAKCCRMHRDTMLQSWQVT